MARGDDTAKLKSLVAEWVNMDSTPDPRIDADDKHYRGFINDACGKLLCPAELDWNDPKYVYIHSVTFYTLTSYYYEYQGWNTQSLRWISCH
jgi:hypothetical protein